VKKKVFTFDAMMDTKYPHLSVAILAGGQNRRFGGEMKALIPWEGKPLIVHLISTLSPLTNDLMVITNTPDRFDLPGVPLIPDKISGYGPLSGIHAALLTAKGPLTLIAACDMPLLSVEVPKKMMTVATEKGKVVVPQHRNGPEPMFSIWPTYLAKKIEAWLSKNRFPKILDFLKEEDLLLALPMFEEEKFFANINSQDEYQQLLKRHPGGRTG
jgi:molybdenum cofactor guanylyltransferase